MPATALNKEQTIWLHTCTHSVWVAVLPNITICPDCNITHRGYNTTSLVLVTLLTAYIICPGYVTHHLQHHPLWLQYSTTCPGYVTHPGYITCPGYITHCLHHPSWLQYSTTCPGYITHPGYITCPGYITHCLQHHPPWLQYSTTCCGYITHPGYDTSLALVTSLTAYITHPGYNTTRPGYITACIQHHSSCMLCLHHSPWLQQHSSCLHHSPWL